MISAVALLCLCSWRLPAVARDADTQPVMSSSSELGPLMPPPMPKGGVELTGDLRPRSSADVAFKVAGQLVSVKVERGQYVTKGQVLAVLSDGEARAQVDQSAAVVTQTSAQLALAQDNEARAAALVAPVRACRPTPCPPPRSWRCAACAAAPARRSWTGRSAC